MQATARRLSVVSATSFARRRLIRDVRPTRSAMLDSPLPPALESACCDFAEEIRRGDWHHVAEAQTQPVPQIPAFVLEIERRCPDYSLEQYQSGLARGLYLTR